MKLLAISDTHGRLSHAEAVIERLNGKISAVLHLGDMIEDARVLETEYDTIPFYYVAGNCDFYFSAERGMEASKLIEYSGVKILMTHGHYEGVKLGYAGVSETAAKAGAQIAVCGHTHEPFSSVVGGVLCVNPGSISFPRGASRAPSYAVIDIPDDGADKFRAGIVYLR